MGRSSGHNEDGNTCVAFVSYVNSGNRDAARQIGVTWLRMAATNPGCSMQWHKAQCALLPRLELILRQRSEATPPDHSQELRKPPDHSQEL